MRLVPLSVLLLIATLLASCRARPEADSTPAPAPPPAATDAAPSPAPATSVTDAWLGKWIGPEGTFLVLAKKGDGYEVTIQSLDGPSTYAGVAAGDHIEFQRDGKTESIRAGSGQETGMKWLLDKKDCLVIRQGEGFCRD